EPGAGRDQALQPGCQRVQRARVVDRGRGGAGDLRSPRACAHGARGERVVSAGRAVLAGLLATLPAVLAAPAVAQSLADSARAVPSPRAGGGWVHDGAGVIGDRRGDIDRVITELEVETSVEIGVVTLSSIGDEVPKDFAVELFNHWGIGKRGKDN